MAENHDTIIIGTGIAGAALGALLAHSGKNVLMLEKNNLIGGRCTSYERNGFTMDVGMHNYLGTTGPIGEVCAQIGMPDAIDWITLPGGQAILQYGDKRGKFTRKAMLELVSEDERENLKRLFTQAIEMSDQELDKLWYVTVDEWVKSFTKDPVAYMFMDNFVGQYVCISSKEASTAEFLLAFRHVMSARVMTYPRGGNISIPKAFISAMEKFGGKVRVNAPVKKVIIENGAAVGVRLEDGTELRAPVIVSNADIKTTVKHLVGEEHFPGAYAQKIEGLTYSFGAATLKVCLTEKVIDEYMVIYMPDVNHPTYIIAEDMEQGKVPEWVGAVSFITSNVDPSLAPEGKQCLAFVVACPIGQDWKAWENMLLKNFYRVHPQAQGKVMDYWLETADWLDTWAGKEGTIIGVGQTVDQVHDRRPSPISPIKGLYYCSADVGRHEMGTGLATSAAQDVFKILTAKESYRFSDENCL
jgi:phytoene dehydrogenase-like protein